MLRVHNRVVDSLVAANFSGDIFVEAKRIVRHHYQWAVVNDFLRRICGKPAVDAARLSVNAPIGSEFRMPVEFAVAAYRFGHSMIRDNYWVNFNFPNATMKQVFDFIRKPLIPVLSNWVVDFNAFFDTGIVVPVNNKARKIDSVLANELESLPGVQRDDGDPRAAQPAPRTGVGPAERSGRREALRGRGAHGGATRARTAADEMARPERPRQAAAEEDAALVLHSARVRWSLHAGEQLGPVGGRIVAETFVTILKRDATSFVNVGGGFSPSLPSATAGDCTFADLVNFSGVTKP